MSVMIWRLRPAIFLPASSPQTPPPSVVLTDWLSITPAVDHTGCRSHRLSITPAVDYAGGGAGLATGRRARFRHQMKIDRRSQSFIAPPAEISLNRRTGRIVSRQHTPLASGLGNVQKRVDDFAHVRFSRPAESLGPGNKPLDYFPFFIDQMRLHTGHCYAHIACDQSTFCASISDWTQQRNHKRLIPLNSFSVRLLGKLAGASLLARCCDQPMPFPFLKGFSKIIKTAEQCGGRQWR